MPTSAQYIPELLLRLKHLHAEIIALLSLRADFCREHCLDSTAKPTIGRAYSCDLTKRPSFLVPVSSSFWLFLQEPGRELTVRPHRCVWGDRRLPAVHPAGALTFLLCLQIKLSGPGRVPPPAGRSDGSGLPRGSSSILAGCLTGRGLMTGALY